MTKTTKQVSTEKQARKPAKKGKRKQAAKALDASTAAVKRGPASARTKESPIKPSPPGYCFNDWLAGYKAACEGGVYYLPMNPDCDGASWHHGYLEGHSQLRSADLVATNHGGYTTEACNALRGLGGNLRQRLPRWRRVRSQVGA